MSNWLGDRWAKAHPTAGYEGPSLQGFVVASSGCTPCRRPLQFQLPLRHGAIPKIEIDDILIGHAQVGRQRFEVRHRILVQADGDRLLEAFDIGILCPLHFGEIVVRAHDITSRMPALPACQLCAPHHSPFGRRQNARSTTSQDNSPLSLFREIVRVNFLQLEYSNGRNADAVVNHQLSQELSIDQHNLCVNT